MSRFNAALASLALGATLVLSGCIEQPPPDDPEVDLQTQSILTGMNNLGGRELTFQPDGSPSYYSRIVTQNVTTFMFDPANGTVVDFNVGDPAQVNLTAPAMVTYYGEDYGTVFVSSSGWISFGAVGNDPADLPTHFLVPQISALPIDALLAGTVTVEETATALVITFQGVPVDAQSLLEGATNSFQVIINIPDDVLVPEQIIISYLEVDTMAGGIVGLSNGQTGNLMGDDLARFLANFMESNLETTNMNTAGMS